MERAGLDTFQTAVGLGWEVDQDRVAGLTMPPFRTTPMIPTLRMRPPFGARSRTARISPAWQVSRAGGGTRVDDGGAGMEKALGVVKPCKQDQWL
jgi:hypothetical protein